MRAPTSASSSSLRPTKAFRASTRSVMSVAVPNHLTIGHQAHAPVRSLNQRYKPSKRRRRASTSNILPSVREENHAACSSFTGVCPPGQIKVIPFPVRTAGQNQLGRSLQYYPYTSFTFPQCGFRLLPVLRARGGEHDEVVDIADGQVTRVCKKRARSLEPKPAGSNKSSRRSCRSHSALACSTAVRARKFSRLASIHSRRRDQVRISASWATFYY